MGNALRRGAASRARLPWQLRLRRRRAIDAAGSTPQLGLAAGLSARSTSSSLLGQQQSLCAKLEAEAVDGERRALEVLDRNGELEGSAPSSISAYGPADPTPRDLQALTVLKSMPLLPDPPNTGFCSLATNFDHESPSSLPHGTSGSSARSICAARGRLSLRTHVPILVIRSILPLLAFVFCSHSSLAGALRARTGGLGLGLGAVKVSRTCS